MKKYTHLVHKQFKLDKKKYAYTIFGIIIAVVLFVSIGEIQYFFNKVDIEYAKANMGDYDSIFENLGKSHIKAIKNNVKVDEYGFIALEHQEKINLNDIEKLALIYAADDICINKMFRKIVVMQEGRTPQNDEEIILDELTGKALDLLVGNDIVIGYKTYKVVGFYKNEKSSSYNVIGITKFNESKNYERIYGIINVKGKRGKVDTINSISTDIGISEEDNIAVATIVNEMLLNAYKELDLLGGMSKSKIVYGVISIFSAIIIYTSVSIALNDRIKQLGILKCMGADTKKLINLIFYESIILYAICIVPGIILGDIIAKVIANIVLNRFIGIQFYGLRLELYTEIVFLAILLSMIMVVTASILCAKRFKRISPIESSNNGNINLKKIKKKKSKLIRNIFGYKGELAYRNIRANNRTFTTTIMSLSISLITFVMITGFYIGTYRNIETGNTSESYDFKIRLTSNHREYEQPLINSIDEIKQTNDKIKEYLSGISGIDEFVSSISFRGMHVFQNVKPSTYLSNKIERLNSEKEQTVVTDGIIYIYDNDAFNKIYPYIEGEGVSLEKFKDGEVILVNIYNSTEKIPIKRFVPFLDIQDLEELEFSLYEYIDMKNSSEDEIENELMNEKKTFRLKVMGNIDLNNLIDGTVSSFNGSIIIMSQEFYEKNKTLLLDNGSYLSSDGEIIGRFNENSINDKYVKQIKAYLLEVQGEYIDTYKENVGIKQNLYAGIIVILTTLILLIIISIANLINNKKISINLRQKEFGTMIAIGMDKKDLKKIIILEDIIQGCIVVLIGGGISYVLLKVTYIVMYYSFATPTMNAPMYLVIISMVVTFIANMLGSIVVLRRFRDVDVAKIIREKE